MAEEVFDRAGVHLSHPGPITVYQAPSSSPADRAILMDCTAVHVNPSGPSCTLELRAISADGSSVRPLSRKALIHPRSSMRMLTGKAVLKAGERLQGIASAGSLLDLSVSVLTQNQSIAQQAIPPVEVYTTLPAPVGVGSTGTYLVPAIDVTPVFPIPRLRLGAAVSTTELPVTVTLPAPQGPPLGAQGMPPSIAVDISLPIPTLNAVPITPYLRVVNSPSMVVDSGPLSVPVTCFGDVRLSTAQSAFTGSSLYLPSGGGGRLILPESSLFSFSGDFCIELSYYQTERNSLETLLELGAYNNGILLRNGDNGIWVNGQFMNFNFGGLNQLNRVALVRSGTTVTAYGNGASAGSLSSVGGAVGGSAARGFIGDSTHAPGRSFKGYIDEVRITKYARYLSNYTPLATPFPGSEDPHYDKVSLLLHMDTQSGFAAPLLGSSGATDGTGWELIRSGNDDNAFIEFPGFEFDFYFGGSAYDRCYIGSNGYVTFGAGSNIWYPDAANPALPKIIFAGGDRSYQRVYIQKGVIQGSVKFATFRWEGSHTTSGTIGSPTIVVEMTFFERRLSIDPQLVEVRYGANNTTGIFGIASSSAYYATATASANSSWVLQGNSEGTSWTMTPNRKVERLA